MAKSTTAKCGCNGTCVGFEFVQDDPEIVVFGFAVDTGNQLVLEEILLDGRSLIDHGGFCLTNH